jgi:hypothetical protein
MQTKKQVLILTIVLFIIITIITLKEKAFAEGLNEYGFPFRFYTFTYCRSKECIEQTGFRSINLILDFLITMSFSFILIKLKNKFSKK